MKKTFLLSLCLFISHLLFSTNYPVSTVNELHADADIAQPGDTIIMTNGTWMDVAITFDANGVDGAPVVLRAETPGQVIISGNSRFRIGGDYLVVTGLKFENCIATESNLISFRRTSQDLAAHSRLTETAIINCNPPDNSTNYKWIGIFGNNNEVDHCYIANKTHIGATLVVWTDESPGNHHIHHNFFGPRPEGNGNGFETIRVGTSTYAEYDGSNVIEHNYFYQTDGEIEIISGKSSNCTYRYNIFRACKGGLTLRHGTNCLVEGNLFFGENKSGSYGVRLIDRDHLVINNYFEGLNGGSSQLRFPICLMNGDANPPDSGYQHVIKNTIAYNTIVNCTKAIMVGAESRPVVPDSCRFINNVVTINNYPPVVHNSVPSNITYSGNFFHRSDDVVSVPASGFMNVDPQLSIAAGDSIYRPDIASPIIGAAVTGLVPETVDFELHSRPAMPACGADEISSGPTIDRGIIGPSWLLSGNPLAVELLQFSVQWQSTCAEISWQTINQEPSTIYTVMRSLDGLNFIPIGQQSGGESTSDWEQGYSLPDCDLERINTQNIFYQLHVLNATGTLQKSKIVVLNLKDSPGSIQFINQPGSSKFALYFPDGDRSGNARATFIVYTLDGRLHLDQQFIYPGETVHIGKDWQPGQYLIHCRYSNGEVESFKWIKMRD